MKKLTVFKREGQTKAALNEIRRNGDIPAVLYGINQDNQSIVVSGVEYRAILRGVKQGGLSSVQFSLEFEGRSVPAVIKQVQYHPTTYQVIHLDFQILEENTKINVKIPIRLLGQAECAGVKLGGMLRQVIRFILVRCLPKDIPEEFALEIRDLGLLQSKRLGEISFPKGVEPLANLSEVVAVVAKR